MFKWRLFRSYSSVSYRRTQGGGRLTKTGSWMLRSTPFYCTKEGTTHWMTKCEDSIAYTIAPSFNCSRAPQAFTKQ
mgnify:FL=1